MRNYHHVQLSSDLFQNFHILFHNSVIYNFAFIYFFQVANTGPADYNYDETISTLRYANRAKNIKNQARVNEDPKDALLRQFQKEIEMLKQQLEDGGGKKNYCRTL